MQQPLTQLVSTMGDMALSGLPFAQPINLAEPIHLALRDIVPDQQTPIAIGIGVLIPIYGSPWSTRRCRSLRSTRATDGLLKAPCQEIQSETWLPWNCQ
jgi:hypothetical protein